MFYNKNGKIYYPNVKKITISSFNGGMSGEEDEGVRSLGYSKLSYNFDASDGALKDGEGLECYSIGLDAVLFPNGVYPLKIYFYKRYDYENDKRDDSFIAYASDGNVYRFNLYAENIQPFFTKIDGLTFSVAPVGITYNYNGNDVLLLSTASDGLKMLNGDEIVEIEGAPPITSMCVHNERIFATTIKNGESVWFSDDFDPTNWNVSLDEGGFINLYDNKGDILKVVSFDGYVYVFRSYGITRITAYANQEDFTVTHLQTSQGKIFKNSVTICGDNVIYLAEDGFYKFNGVNAYRVMRCYDAYLKGVDNSTAEGVFSNGKLYMKLKMRLSGTIEDVVIVYKADDKSTYVIKDCNVTSIAAADGEIRHAVATYKNCNFMCYFVSGGCLFSTPYLKVWKSADTDFGVPSVVKRLEKIRFITDCDVTVTVTADDAKSKTYKVKGGGVREIKPYIKGETFSLEFKSEKRFSRIVSPTIYVSWF